MLRRTPLALYAAFDRFPTRKGASVHIARFAETLFDEFSGGLLYVLGDEAMPAYQFEEGGVEIVRHIMPNANFLERAVAFSSRLERLLDEIETREEQTATQNDAPSGARNIANMTTQSVSARGLRVCHFRDILSGVPVLTRRRNYKTVFEVNALPSIELPHTYPYISARTMEKIRAREDFCLKNADAIITPSETIRDCVLRRGASPEKVTVIPNGADVSSEVPPRPSDAPNDEYIIYFGALQIWQGVGTLLRAFALLGDLEDLRLVICASERSRQTEIYERLAADLELTGRVVWRFNLLKDEIASWVAHAAISVAPLAECGRNVEQGCAPLKILESMAAGVAVVASDLPAVREIIPDEDHGRLVHADRPGELARAIRVLLQYPNERRRLGANAQARIKRQLTWRHATEKLRALYGETNS